MDPDTSRALARFIAALGLGRAAARQLADEYGDTAAADLPLWISELAAVSGEGGPP
jgi:hypothetical protein